MGKAPRMSAEPPYPGSESETAETESPSSRKPLVVLSKSELANLQFCDAQYLGVLFPCAGVVVVVLERLQEALGK